jgi:serine palmitoyltransferase
VDAREVDMIIGNLSGPLCAAGGFCASTQEVVEHQRISSASYTYSAALPAMLSTTASETIAMLQEQPEILTALRENIKAMRAQLDPRSDWVKCTSSIDNPIMILVLKPEVVASKGLSVEDQNMLLQDVVDEVSSLYFSNSMVVRIDMCAVSYQRGPHHPRQGVPARSGCTSSRRGLAAYACAEGVRYVWADEEGDGEGGGYGQACHYQDCHEEKVGLG